MDEREREREVMIWENGDLESKMGIGFVQR